MQPVANQSLGQPGPRILYCQVSSRVVGKMRNKGPKDTNWELNPNNEINKRDWINRKKKRRSVGKIRGKYQTRKKPSEKDKRIKQKFLQKGK